MKNAQEPILEYLLELVDERKYDEQFLMPSENRLAERFGVSRYVARAALDKLERRRYLRRIQGKGTFIDTEYLRTHEASDDRLRCRIAVVLPLAVSSFLFQIIKAVDGYFFERGIVCAYYYANSQQQEDRILRTLGEQHCDGILLYPVNNLPPSEELIKLIEQKYPLVLIDRYYKEYDVHTVSSNHFGSSYKLIDCFLSLNKRNVCLVIQDPAIATAVAHRVSGFRQAISQKLPHSKTCTELLFLEESADLFQKKLTDHLLANPETDAIITNSGILATYTLNVLRKLRKRPGSDVALALYDDEIYGFDLLTGIPYIKVNQNTAEIGSTAARVLHDLLSQKSVPLKVTDIPTTLEYVNFD